MKTAEELLRADGATHRLLDSVDGYALRPLAGIPGPSGSILYSPNPIFREARMVVVEVGQRRFTHHLTNVDAIITNLEHLGVILSPFNQGMLYGWARND